MKDMIKIRFFTWLMLIGMTLASGTSYASEPDAPREDKRQQLAHTMASLVISVIRDTKKSATDRRESLEQGFSKVMDIDWIAKFVLGSNWRHASEEQRERYTQLYRQYLVKVYVENYAETPTRKLTNIKVLGVVDNHNGTYLARTEVQLVDGNSLRVDYIVREEEEESGTGKIIDVIIEGISLLTSHRTDFSRLAASKGVDGVIAKLESLVGTPVLKLSMR